MWTDIKKKLNNKINNSNVKCIFHSKDRYKRFLATCLKDKINLNRWMVNGHAIAYKNIQKIYIEMKIMQKMNKLGYGRGFL